MSDMWTSEILNMMQHMYSKTLKHMVRAEDNLTE